MSKQPHSNTQTQNLGTASLSHSDRQARNAGSQKLRNLCLKIKVLTTAPGMYFYVFRQQYKLGKKEQ